MPQPTPYTPTADFSADELANVGGRSTVRTAALDAELAGIATTLGGVLGNLALIQRDDGEIRDERVKIHTLAPEVRALLTASGVTLRGEWVSGRSYSVKDVVGIGGTLTYICCTAHTSSALISTDIAAQRWLLIGSAGDAATAVAGLAADLASSAGASLGAGMIGFDPAYNYAIGTLGEWVKRGPTVTPEQFGAVGDGVADDAAEIQAALDFLAVTTWTGTQAGGWSRAGGMLVLTPGKTYRITAGLRVGAGTTILGNGSVGSTSQWTTTRRGAVIRCDFPGDKKQWAISSATYETGAVGGSAGLFQPLNRVYSGNENNAAISTLTQGIKLLGLHIEGHGAYGGIRLTGSSGFALRDCLVVNVGCAYLLNTCFGGAYSNIMGLYSLYGLVVAHCTALEAGHAYMDRQYTGWTADSTTRLLRSDVGDPGGGLPAWADKRVGMYFLACLQMTMQAHVSEGADVAVLFDFTNVFRFYGYAERSVNSNYGFLASSGVLEAFGNETVDGPRYHIGTGNDLVFEQCTRGHIVQANTTSKVVIRGEDTTIADTDWTWGDNITFDGLASFSVSAAGTTTGVYGAITLQEAMRRISISLRRDWTVVIADGATVATTGSLTLTNKDIVFKKGGAGSNPTISVGQSGAGAGTWRWTFAGPCSVALEGVNVAFPSAAPLATDKGLFCGALACNLRATVTNATINLGNGFSLFHAFNGLPVMLDCTWNASTITASTAARILEATGPAVVTSVQAGCTVDAGIKALGTNGWGGTVLASNF